MTSVPADDKAWRALLAPYKRASWGRALLQLADTAVPFVLLWTAMAFAVERGAWWASLLLTIPASLASVAEKLGMNEGAIKVAVHRMRQRYRKILREQIELTVDSPGEVDGEIQHLFKVFGVSG